MYSPERIFVSLISSVPLSVRGTRQERCLTLILFCILQLYSLQMRNLRRIRTLQTTCKLFIFSSMVLYHLCPFEQEFPEILLWRRYCWQIADYVSATFVHGKKWNLLKLGCWFRTYSQFCASLCLWLFCPSAGSEFSFQTVNIGLFRRKCGRIRLLPRTVTVPFGRLLMAATLPSRC